MTKSGIAELRRLLRNRDSKLADALFDASLSEDTFNSICRWKENPYSEGALAYLPPAELRMFLQLVLYAETDK